MRVSKQYGNLADLYGIDASTKILNILVKFWYIMYKSLK
jgi:hypothetical protein